MTTSRLIRLNTLSRNSIAADEVRNSTTLEGPLIKTLECHRPEIQAAFAGGADVLSFGPWPIVTEEPGSVGRCKGNSISFFGTTDEDLGLSFGQTTIQAELRVTYRRDGSKLVLEDHRIEGTVGPDLYDWDQRAAAEDAALAAVQAGYGTLGNAGHIA